MKKTQNILRCKQSLVLWDISNTPQIREKKKYIMQFFICIYYGKTLFLQGDRYQQP